MFLDQELKRIQEAKANLATCCELRRILVDIEVRGVWRKARSTVSNLGLGLAVAEQILGLLRERKGGRR
jgi:hypothetical protein